LYGKTPDPETNQAEAAGGIYFSVPPPAIFRIKMLLAQNYNRPLLI